MRASQQLIPLRVGPPTPAKAKLGITIGVAGRRRLLQLGDDLLDRGADQRRGGRRLGAAAQSKVLKRKFMSCSHFQELGQLADLASDWLFSLLVDRTLDNDYNS